VVKPETPVDKTPSANPIIRQPVEPEPRNIYRPPQRSDILPGRPIWISAYAIMLAMAGMVMLGGLAYRTFTGVIGETYENLGVVCAIILVALGAIFTALQLWWLTKRGLQLIIITQAVWILGAITSWFWAYSNLPAMEHPKLLDHSGQYLFIGIAVVATIILIAPNYRPDIRLLVITIGFFIVIFVVLGLAVLELPSRLIYKNRQELIELVALSVASVPLNILFLVGLYLDRTRFV
jgi:hypothetical protein